MRRKAGAGRPPPEIGQLTPARALRQAVAQAAQDVAALVAVAGTVEEARTTLGKVVEALPDYPLLGLVEGPGSRFGLVVLDGQMVAALIEMQTTGRVVPRPAPARAPTRTDAIMCADFIDRLLELIELQLREADPAVAAVFSGYRYAMALSETRAIAMTLDDVPYRQLSVPVDLGQGKKSGEITLILPLDPQGKSAAAGHDKSGFTEALRDRVLDTGARLTTTLARRRMTLAEVAELTVGSVIALPREVLGAVEIEDIAGRVVAHGRLGQVDGHRAVRVRVETGRDTPRDYASGAPPLQLERTARFDADQNAADPAGANEDTLTGLAAFSGMEPVDDPAAAVQGGRLLAGAETGRLAEPIDGDAHLHHGVSADLGEKSD